MNKRSRKILCELDENARSNLSNISKSCRTSQQMVSYTIKQLLKKNIILGFSTVFDYSRFDLNSYIVLFRLFYKNKKDFNNFINYLKHTPEVSKVEILDGKWDVYAMFLAPNPSYFNKMLHKIKADNVNLIRNDMIITTVVTYLFTRNYLRDYKKTDKKYVIVGGDREITGLTDNQQSVCKFLLEKPLARIKDISKKTGMSFLTITNAIKILSKIGVIRGFKPVINFENAEIICKKLLIKYQGGPVFEQKIVSYCRQHMNVIDIVKSFGEWDLIVTVETTKKGVFNNFLIGLRELYEDIISDFEIVDVLKTEALRYLPKNHFDEESE
ncbi:MAG: Lrp/AsnC family transcriptional regulator [DPANN group archaeon]|nr:Lrp/AsnC family transcriptional regulator [DPANN group archaeon]